MHRNEGDVTGLDRQKVFVAVTAALLALAGTSLAVAGSRSAAYAKPAVVETTRALAVVAAPAAPVPSATTSPALEPAPAAPAARTTVVRPPRVSENRNPSSDGEAGKPAATKTERPKAPEKPKDEPKTPPSDTSTDGDHDHETVTPPVRDEGGDSDHSDNATTPTFSHVGIAGADRVTIGNDRKVSKPERH